MGVVAYAFTSTVGFGEGTEKVCFLTFSMPSILDGLKGSYDEFRLVYNGFAGVYDEFGAVYNEFAGFYNEFRTVYNEFRPIYNESPLPPPP
ncbi:hypothetical protein [Alteribacter aurantiacus]|uniref:hypothetical protein n=1 Tax=Alteribacter aurantiacus TaxID=254410 RepID=UPI0003FD0622|nr:hypothetical protein [Alteribacter aurantiacus]